MCFASLKGGQVVSYPQMNEMHMANHLVRWWKTKVINGYKHFTAVLPSDCNDGRPSDTEELLGMPFYDLPTDPPSKMTNVDSEKGSPNSPKCSAKKQLKFEEFECDLSVEGGVNGQEFSFTLYDFDGHGKITKDDIAGLVTTIYETIGSSIRVPHYGSKTIKVKLTVSPDKSTSNAEASTNNNNNNVSKKRDLNVTIRERRAPGHPRRSHKSNLRRRHSISSSAPSEDREADISEDDNEVANERLSTNNNNSDLSSPNNCCSRTKKRSSSLQRQELLQIIQANMEKNHLCFQTSRKHCGVDSSFPNHHRNRHKRHSSFHQSSTQCPVFSPQYTNKLFPTNKNQSPNNISTPGYVTPSKVSPPGYLDPATHRKNFNESPQLNHFINEDKLKSSPHYLKHRHREQDQARAMAQVVKWLEQEEVFKASPNHRSKSKHSEKHTTKTSENRSKSCNSDKHEHHHIHEHVHHHYHHYNESPVLV